MSSNELVGQIVAQVITRVTAPEQQAIPGSSPPTWETAMAEKSCSLTEFVDTTIGDAVGLVIANVGSTLLDAMRFKKRYRSIGILGARTDTSPHVMAADEAVETTDTEVVSIELPRDTKGGAGHSSLIILGGNDVSDVRRGIEVALRGLDRTFGDVYANETGHIEVQYTAYTSYALERASGAPIGRACGATVDTPVSIGILVADMALKSTNVEIVAHSPPTHDTSFSNETILVVSGDSGAVRQATIFTHEIDETVLGTLDSEPKNNRPSYT